MFSFTPPTLAAVVLLLLVSAPCGGASGGGDASGPSLDVDRPPNVLSVGPRPAGRTYVDAMDLTANSHVDLPGGEGGGVDSTTHMRVESETDVSDLPEGGTAVDSTVKRLSMESEMGGAFLKCDTEIPRGEADPNCYPFYGVVDVDYHFVVDDVGTVVMNGAEDEQDSASAKNAALDKISPSQQLQQTSRLLKFLPVHAVRPGDTWDASVEDLGDDMGDFQGTATLLGYKAVNGHDCAVIETEGEIHMDMARVAAAMGGGALGDAVKDITVSGARLESTMYWDDEARVVRESRMTMSFVMEMSSPVEMSIPVSEEITTTTKIKDE